MCRFERASVGRPSEEVVGGIDSLMLKVARVAFGGSREDDTGQHFPQRFRSEHTAIVFLRTYNYMLGPDNVFCVARHLLKTNR